MGLVTPSTDRRVIGGRMRPIIGLTGKAGSGKDTAAQCIIDAGYPVARIAFADALKSFVSVLFGVDYAALHDREQKECMVPLLGKTYRQILCEFGAKTREIDAAIWIHWADLEVQKLIQCDTGVVFTDIRYTNETKYIRGLGGRIVEIERPDVVHPDATTRQHPSENYDGPTDATIINTGDLDQFRAQVVALVRIWYGTPGESAQLHTVIDTTGPG